MAAGLIPPATAEADLVTLSLDHPDRHWPAFALVDRAPALSLGRQLVLLPGPGSKNRDT